MFLNEQIELFVDKTTFKNRVENLTRRQVSTIS